MENTGEGRLAGGEGRRSSCSFETAERTDHCARCHVERSERELRWACVFGSYCYGRVGAHRTVSVCVCACTHSQGRSVHGPLMYL